MADVDDELAAARAADLADGYSVEEIGPNEASVIRWRTYDEMYG